MSTICVLLEHSGKSILWGNRLGAVRVGKVEEQVERDLCEVGTKKSAYESSEGEQEPGGSGTRETAGQCSGGQRLSLQRTG